jgi:DNA polymerase-3 subunit beta
MKIHFDRKSIENALQKTIKAVSPKSPLPILSYVLIKSEEDGTVSFSTTDLEFGIKCKVQAKVVERGSVCVPARLITELVAQIHEDQITLICDEERPLEVTTFKAKYHMNTRDVDEFPILPQPQDTPLLTMMQGTFREMIKSAIIAVAPPEEQRASLTGVFMQTTSNDFVAVSTDGKRLVRAKEILEEAPSKNLSVIVPQRSLREAANLLGDNELPVNITFSEGQIFLEFDNTFLFSRIIDGKYPNYEVAIPRSSDIRLLVDKEKLTNAIKRALIMAKDKETPDLLKIEVAPVGSEEDYQGIIKIMSNSIDVGDADEEVYVKEMEGSTISVAFNGRYILEVLNLLNDEFVWLLMNNPVMPVVIRSLVKENYTYLVMPVRIKKREEERMDDDVPVNSYT